MMNYSASRVLVLTKRDWGTILKKEVQRMPRVLIVEDDQSLTATLANFLTRERFVVEISHDGKEGLYWLLNQSFDVAIVDWELPGMSGVDMCQQYRKAGGSIPLLMLTGRGATSDKVEGFEAGADDYLSKPFDPVELSIRLRALLRRPGAVQRDVVVVGDIELDTSKGTVKRQGQVVKFSRTEFAILEVLMRNVGRIFSAENLIERVWGAEAESTELAVRTHITRIRGKLESAADGKSVPLKNVYGMGYKLEEF